ncbi:MAG: hypothetical protein KKH75_03940 [Actinobacteria bacterium]|nr:hypothetical protein [Actinomycetota bacterium]
MFAMLIPMVVLGLVAVLFIKEVPLRSSIETVHEGRQMNRLRMPHPQSSPRSESAPIELTRALANPSVPRHPFIQNPPTSRRPSDDRRNQNADHLGA